MSRRTARSQKPRRRRRLNPASPPEAGGALLRRTPGAGGEEVAGYAVYTCHTSLCATIIVLAYPCPEVKASTHETAVSGHSEGGL